MTDSISSSTMEELGLSSSTELLLPGSVKGSKALLKVAVHKKLWFPDRLHKDFLEVQNELNDVELNVIGNDPVIVRFSNVSFSSDVVKCVRFGADGTVEFSNVTAGNSCVANGLGHFSVVIPSEPINGRRSRKTQWWVVGIVFGVTGLMLLVLLGAVMYKMIRRKKIREMENESERSEGLDTMWIGRSRMPSASGYAQGFVVTSCKMCAFCCL